MAVYTEPTKKINVQLDIEEIVLIKECLFDSISKQEACAKNPRTSIALIGPTSKKADALQKLMDRLSGYGYGYQET